MPQTHGGFAPLQPPKPFKWRRLRRLTGGKTENAYHGNRSLPQIALADEREPFFNKELGGQGGVVDVERQGRAAWGDEQGVGVVNVDLGGEQGGADAHEGMLRAL